MNPNILRAAILQSLSDHDQLATERYVVLALAVDFGIKASFSEVRDILAKLDEHKYVVGIRREDSQMLWSATGLGKSVLSELR